MKFRESLILSICHFVLFLLLSIIKNFCSCPCNKSENHLGIKGNNLIGEIEDDDYNYETHLQEFSINETQKKMTIII